MHTASARPQQSRDDDTPASDETLVGAIETGRGRQIRVTRSTYRGRQYVAARVWFDVAKGADPEWRPTRKGFNLPLDDAPELARLIERAAAER